MAKYNSSGFPSTGVVTTGQLKQELDEIAASIADQLDRKGASPNNMEVDLDMNSRRILNLPDALSDSEPLTLRQFNGQATGVKTTGTLKSKVVATAGQTVFVTPGYVVGSNNLHVYVNGVRQANDSYSEDNKNQVTFSSPLQAGDVVEFVVNELPDGSGTIPSTSVTHNGETVATVLNKRFFNSVADMVADTTLKIGDIVQTLGYYSEGDGGGNIYEIVAAGTGTADGGSYIDLTGVSGQAKGLFVDGVVNVKQFGARGDGVTDDTSFIQAAIDYANTQQLAYSPSRYIGGRRVYIPSGTYTISSAIKVYQNIKVCGDGATATRIVQTTSGEDCLALVYNEPLATDQSAQGVDVLNLLLDGSGAGEAGITNTDRVTSTPISYCSFKGLQIVGFKVGIHLFGAWNNVFDNILIRASTHGNANGTDGLIGIILETVDSGSVVGPSGKTHTTSGSSGGVNNNTFVNVNVNFVSVAGCIIRAVSGAHAYSNIFIGCNFEAIKDAMSPTYSPYTDTTSTTWSGNPVGVLAQGRVSGCLLLNSYFEDIGGTVDGVGVHYDDYGITFGSGASKCFNNVVKTSFFNSNVAVPIHYTKCRSCGSENNVILQASGKGILVDSTAVGCYSIGEGPELFDSVNSTGTLFRDATTSTSRVLYGPLDKEVNAGFNGSLGKAKAIESDTQNFEEEIKYVVGGGKRKIERHVKSNGGSDVVSYYTEVSTSGTTRHGFVGLPKNTGTGVIPASTTGSYTHILSDVSDADTPVAVTITTTGHGISNVWVERTAFDRFTIYFSGTTTKDTTFSYMMIGM